MHMRWKKVLLTLAIAFGAGAVYLSAFPVGQRADRSFDTSVDRPAFTSHAPLVLYDEGHHNAHRLRGTYAPFCELLRSDGYRIEVVRERFTAAALARARILVSVNAAGGSNPKLFGFNLVPLRKGRRDAAAYTAAEIEAVRKWVADGGSLLLVADHYPFGVAMRGLAAAFGVTMHGGYVEVEDQYAGQTDASSVRFSRENGLLPLSPIVTGRHAAERVDVVQSFTGQSLDAREGFALLALPPSAVEYVPPPPEFKEQRAGRSQAVALEYGRGRVIVLGEAGMLTAQIEDGRRFGMNLPGIDNRQFALNIMHWLSRLL